MVYAIFHTLGVGSIDIGKNIEGSALIKTRNTTGNTTLITKLQGGHQYCDILLCHEYNHAFISGLLF